ncbi:Uncharacterized protein dnl_26130 [Desulfonema limicola]|uniref:Uncharacterized protein n=2 Tax=Desulfonema limicola TaxID=45656 RepID=A0A975B836_9BACT|nr:Uncharacterized protein dnl_26130 [Desulfonema limicola]
MTGRSDTMIRYEMGRIKDRAEKGVSNRGRVIYQYADDSSIENMNNFGNVYLDRDSRVREVYVGVDIDEHLRFDRGNSLNIGNVETRQRDAGYLKKVNIIVDIEKPIDF